MFAMASRKPQFVKLSGEGELKFIGRLECLRGCTPPTA